MSFRSAGSPTISRKHSGGDSFSNDGGVEVHNISFGRERSVSQHRKELGGMQPCTNLHSLLKGHKHSSSSNTPPDPLVSSRLGNFQPPVGEDGDLPFHKVGFIFPIETLGASSLAHSPRSRS